MGTPTPGTPRRFCAASQIALAGAWGNGDRLYMQGPWKPGVPNQGYQLPLTPAQLYRAGIAATNAHCIKTYGKTFDRLDAAQSGKAADLAGAFGGAGSQTAFGPRGAASVLSQATTWCAVMFMVCAMAMVVRVDRSVEQGGSILQKFSKPAAAATKPTPASPAPATPAPQPQSSTPQPQSSTPQQPAPSTPKKP